MARSVEHLVAVHQLVVERRDIGKPAWARTIDLSRVFHDETLSFEERRDALVRRLKASRWFREADQAEFDGVYDIVTDHLAYAEDSEEWDDWWDELYDLADFDRVWIKTQ